MRRKLLNSKAMPIIMAASMAMSLAACGPASNPPAAADPTTAPTEAPTEAPSTGTEPTEAPAESTDPYPVITDADGNPIDLGGIEITIRDWWTNPDDLLPENAKNDFDEEVANYRVWAQEKYNFKMTQTAISDWGSTPTDFVDYVTSGGDDNNYIWIVRDDPAIAQAMATGLMYDLSTLDCLDFTQPKFTSNLLHKQYTYKGGIYAMYTGLSEPRDGLFINETLLNDNNIDPDTIYDMQADGTWTWDKFTEIMDKIQQDTDNDGTNDIWGFTGNTGSFTADCVYSNGGEFIGSDSNGYVYKLEDPKTVEGLEFSAKVQTDYYMPRPEDAEWDYYKQEFLNGTVAFCCDGFYAGCSGSYFETTDFDMGFVMMPAGPQGKMVNCWSNNPVAIPGCYDADTAWKLAMAYNIWTEDVPGYEDYNGQVSRARSGNISARGCDETVPMMCEMEHGCIAYTGMVPGLEAGPTLIWNIGPGADVSAAIDGAAESWKTYINDANKGGN